MTNSSQQVEMGHQPEVNVTSHLQGVQALGELCHREPEKSREGVGPQEPEKSREGVGPQNDDLSLGLWMVTPLSSPRQMVLRQMSGCPMGGTISHSEGARSLMQLRIGSPFLLCCSHPHHGPQAHSPGEHGPQPSRFPGWLPGGTSPAVQRK